MTKKTFSYEFKEYELTINDELGYSKCNDCTLSNCNGYRHDPSAVYLYPTCCDCGVELNDLIDLLKHPKIRSTSHCDICYACGFESVNKLNTHFFTHFYKSTSKHESKFQCINCFESNNSQNIKTIYLHPSNVYNEKKKKGKRKYSEIDKDEKMKSTQKLQQTTAIYNIKDEDEFEYIIEEVIDCQENHDFVVQPKEHTIKHKPPKQVNCKSKQSMISKSIAIGTNTDRKFAHKLKNLYTEVKPEKFECSLCAQAFDTKVDLNYHRKTEHSIARVTPDILQCRLCDLEFYEKKHRVDHETSVHLDHETNMYQCPHCDVQRKTGSSLAYHMLNHTIDKPHICTICGKAFRREHNLVGHYVIHNSVKIHKCHLCTKTFNTLALRNRHLRLKHTDIRPYECPLCQKKYKDFSDLRRHKWTHGGYEKKFKCVICSKAFFENRLLKTHMKIHNKNIENNEPINYYMSISHDAIAYK